MEKALSINPNHADCYATLGNVLAWDGSHFFLAFAYYETGRKDKARAEIGELLRLNPDYSLELIRTTLPLKNPAKLERILNALRQSGLK